MLSESDKLNLLEELIIQLGLDLGSIGAHATPIPLAASH